MNASKEYSRLATCFRSAKKILRIFLHLPQKMLTLRMTKGGDLDEPRKHATKSVAEGVDPYNAKKAFRA